MYFRVAAFGRLRLRQGDAAQEDAGGGNCETAALPRTRSSSSLLASPRLYHLQIFSSKVQQSVSVSVSLYVSKQQ